MDERLIDFLKKHMERGSDMDKVKQALLNAGHDIYTVEEHLRNALEDKNNMRHKLTTPTLSIAVLIIVVIISAAGFYYFPDLYKKTDSVINESRNAEIENQKNLEMFNKALITNDMTACNNIQDDKLKEECQGKLLFNISNATRENASEELQLGNEILNKALITHNKSLCVEIMDEIMKNICEQKLEG